MPHALAIIIILLGMTCPAMAADKTTGLAITTSDFQHGDEAEKAMWNLVGQMPSVNHVYHADSTDAFLKRLARYQKAGYKLDHLVIAGHGHKDTPSISFDKGLMQASDLDVADLRKRVIRLKKAAKTRKEMGEPYKHVEARVKEVEARIHLFDRVSRVMAPKAQVLMINCSPAATEEGRKFVNALGQLLLGREGGSIKASKSDVTLGQVQSLANKIRAAYHTGKWLDIGEYFDYGDYEEFEIPKSRDAQGDKPSQCLRWKSTEHCASRRRVCVNSEQYESCVRWKGNISNPDCAEYKTYTRCKKYKRICERYRMVRYCDEWAK